MSNNYWDQQDGNNQAAQRNGNPRPGSKVYNYSERPLQAPSQYAPPAGQAPQGMPHSPMPPVYTTQQQSWPASQGAHLSSFFGSTMHTVKRWSGKMVSARGGNADQSPLVLYHPPTPPLPPKTKPWKRSRTVRIAMQMRHRRERWKQAHPSGMKILSTTLIIFSLLLVVAISSGTASAYAYYQNQLPRLQGLANQQIDQTTRIYDRNGQLLYRAYDNREGRRTPVTFNYIPGVMKDSMVATEDHTFWDNTGIDLQGILRAVTEYASSGSIASGGSTITQQLIKNLTGDTQVSLQRKIPEAALAIGLTQQYPKWKILEMYLNVSPFGAQELGVEAAVEDYFGLKPQCDQNFKCIPAIANLDLDPKTGKRNPLLALARASLLAGLPQNPVTYDPTGGPNSLKAALARQDYVLQQMLSLNMHLNTGLDDQTIDNGPITPDIIQQVEAMTAKMTFAGYQYIKRAPHFVDWVRNQLEIALGNGDEELGVHLFLTGGFNIRTTIDANLASFVENNVRHHLRDPGYQSFGISGPLNTLHDVNDSAVVVMNAKTGEILAMDGSADYYNSSNKKIAGNVNAAVCYDHPYCRQPGSSFKPIVYATAFQMGWYPGIVLPDRKTYFPNSAPPNCAGITFIAYCPVDYGGGYHNLNSNIVLNIANSFNVPAVKALEFAGFENVLNMARRFGITDIDQDAAAKHETVEKMIGPSLALGAAGISLLQMVGAYQVFANQGTRIPPQGILDIWDNYGHHLYHYDPTHPPEVQVVSPQIAFLMSSILSDDPARNYEFGSSSSVLTMQDWDNRPVAAKTGTSDDFRDNLTLGYTPDLVVGVWSGNADGTPMAGVVGISGAAPIWHDVIEYASGKCKPGCNLSFPQDQFVQPPGVIQQSVNTVNGLAGSGYISWMLESDKPQQSGIITNNGNGNGTPTPTPKPKP
jgi:membrane peptidoglycan carboxypeptidase